MSSRSFEYRGDLAATPLAEILATIDRYKVPGVVSVSRENRLRRIYVEDGFVVFAVSNEREAGLARYLFRQGALDAETAREAEQRQSRDGLRIGQILLAMGVVTPERLNTAIAGQIREILLGALEWDTGEIHCEVGARRTADFARVELPISEIILEGIRKAPDVKRLVRRLGTASTVLEKTAASVPSLFSTSERALHDAVDGKTPLQELCSRGPGAVAENARLLYAFYCLGLLRKTRAGTSRGKKIQYRTEQL